MEEELTGPRVIIYNICKLVLSLNAWKVVVMPVETEKYRVRAALRGL